MITGIRRLFNKSLVNKLVLSYIVIILAPIFILGYYSYINLADNIKKNYAVESRSKLKNIDKVLQTYFEDLKRLTSNAFLSEDIQQIINSNTTDGWIVSENQRLFNKVRLNLIGDRTDIGAVMLICDKGDIYGDTGYIKLDYNIRNEDWYKEIEAANSGFVIIGNHKQNYSFRPQSSYVTIAGRRIKDLNSGMAKAVFLIELKTETLNKLLNEFSSDGTKLVVTDKDDKIVFDNEPSNITKTMANVYPGMNPEIAGKNGFEVDYGDYITYGMNGVMTHWNYIHLTKRDTLFSQIRGFALNIVLISVVCFILFLILSVYISLRLTKSLKTLRDSMKKVEKGNFNEKIDLKNLQNIEEINELSISYNTMVEEIRHLITKVYETQLKKIDSDFKALQAQINPHFLYNTLESINCLAQIKEAEDISEMVRGLARVFRYSVKDNTGFVTIEEEINHVKDYVLLQTVRYNDKFEVKYSIPEHMLGMKIIKFSLQPLVENAIYHGIEKSKEKGLIHISAITNQDKLIVTVSNNGVLIEKERLIEIQTLLNSDINDVTEYEVKTRSIGIFNIHMRIRLNFGMDYGLQINSDNENGTVVNLVFPREIRGELNV